MCAYLCCLIVCLSCIHLSIVRPSINLQPVCLVHICQTHPSFCLISASYSFPHTGTLLPSTHPSRTIRFSGYGRSSDIWSFGATMIEMGECPVLSCVPYCVALSFCPSPVNALKGTRLKLLSNLITRANLFYLSFSSTSHTYLSVSYW